jgi:glycosyltransferase involved in cell wall biosynthesis
MKERMRVLMLTAFPAIGGPLPKLAPLVADGLRRCDCEVAIEGWSAHVAGRESLVAKIAGRSADLVRVRRRIREWKPDVVYVVTSHNWPTLLRDVPLALTMTGGSPPLVLHLHGSECDRLREPGTWLFTSLSLWLMRHVSAVLVLSTEELRAWRGLCPEGRFHLVRNPFVPTASRARESVPLNGLGGGCATLLFVGRLVAEKGIFELLDALSIVRRQRRCRLVVAGRGEAERETARRIRLLGLGQDVSMLGYVTDGRLESAYQAADVFVLPSYREGFPLVVMEAMSYGLPIVTTPIRGCADHLVPDENALFVPPRDPEELARAIERLLDDEALRQRMGAANRAKVAHFAPDSVMPRYAEILRSVATAKEGGA